MDITGSVNALCADDRGCWSDFFFSSFVFFALWYSFFCCLFLFCIYHWQNAIVEIKMFWLYDYMIATDYNIFQSFLPRSTKSVDQHTHTQTYAHVHTHTAASTLFDQLIDATLFNYNFSNVFYIFLFWRSKPKKGDTFHAAFYDSYN